MTQRSPKMTHLRGHVATFLGNLDLLILATPLVRKQCFRDLDKVGICSSQWLFQRWFQEGFQRRTFPKLVRLVRAQATCARLWNMFVCIFEDFKNMRLTFEIVMFWEPIHIYIYIYIYTHTYTYIHIHIHIQLTESLHGPGPGWAHVRTLVVMYVYVY